MGEFLHTLYDWLVDAFYSFWELIVLNLLWLAFSLLVIGAPPACAGLCYATNRMAHSQSVTWRDFFGGMREFFWLSWRWGGLNLLVGFILFANYWFYAGFEGSWVEWIRGGILALAAIWLALQLYTLPLLMEQSDRRLRVALRNSAVMILKRPFFSLAVALLVLVLLALSSSLLIPLWFVATASLSTYLANHTVIYLVEEITADQERWTISEEDE